jgi:hypothetical protein
MKLNIVKRLLRIYLTIWLMLSAILLIQTYKGVLTVVGLTYWTEQSVRDRSFVECQKNENSIDCLSVPANNPTDKELKKQANMFIWGAVVIPLAILFLGWVFNFFIRWIKRGFLDN